MSRNFSCLSITYSQTRSIKNMIIMLKGSHRPRIFTIVPRTPRAINNNILTASIHLMSNGDILWGDRCLIPQRKCKYSYYLTLSSERSRYILYFCLISSNYFLTFSIYIKQNLLRAKHRQKQHKTQLSDHS